MSSQQLLLGTGGAKKKYIEDVFSTGGHYISYTGNQTHPTGMDLTSDDGLTIFHRYLGGGVGNTMAFLDTFNRSGNNYWELGQTAQMQENGNSNYWTGFNSSGVTCGNYWSAYQSSSNSWPQNATYNQSYKKSKGFFDLVEWTANGSQQTMNHDLGTQPGFIMIKKLTGSTNQGRTFGYHRQMRANGKGWVQSIGNTSGYNYVNANSSTFTVDQVNNSFVTAQENGAKYVAYIWADYDSADWGETGDQSIIKCGMFTGDGSTSPGQIVDVGWDPHIIHFWGQNGSSNYTFSQDLGIATLGGEWLNDESCARYLDWNQQNGGYHSSWPHGGGGNFGGVYNPFSIIPGKGFQVRGNGTNINQSGQKYYYVAIRRAGQKPVENVSDYFDIKKWSGNSQLMRRVGTSSFAGDFTFLWKRNGNDNQHSDRAGMLRSYMDTSSSKSVNGRLDDRSNPVELMRYSSQYAPFWNIPKTYLIPNAPVFNDNNNGYLMTLWKRNYGVMSQVNFYGTGSSTYQTLNHDLGVKPTMIIVMQNYDSTGYQSKNIWCDSTVGNKFGDNKLLSLVSDAPIQTRNDHFGDGSGGWVASDTQFRVNEHQNGTGNRYFSAYLFASIAGQVKFGQYTGNGSSTGDSQNIDCGFSNGIKWVIIHKIDGGDGGNDRGGWIMASPTQSINNGTNSYDSFMTTWGGGQQFSSNLYYGESKASGSYVTSGNYLNDVDMFDNNYSAGFVVKKPPAYNYNTPRDFKWDVNRNGWTYFYWAVAA